MKLEPEDTVKVATLEVSALENVKQGCVVAEVHQLKYYGITLCCKSIASLSVVSEYVNTKVKSLWNIAAVSICISLAILDTDKVPGAKGRFTKHEVDCTLL